MDDVVYARTFADRTAAARPARPRHRSRALRRGSGLAIADLGLVYLSILPLERTFGLLKGVSDARRFIFICSVAIWVIAAATDGLYSRAVDLDQSPTAWLPVLARAAALGSLGVFSIAWGLGLRPTIDALLAMIVISFVATAGGRIALDRFARRYRRPVRGVIVGSTALAGIVAEKLARHGSDRVEVVGILDDAEGNPDRDVPVLGSLDDLEAILEQFDVGCLFVSAPALDEEETFAAVMRARGLGVDVYVLPVGVGVISPIARMHWIEGLPVIGLEAARRSRVTQALKRGVDIVVSAVAIVALLPLLLVIAIGIKLDSPGPVLYRHRRVGRGGKAFDVLKFRTMHQDQCRGEAYGGANAEEVFASLVASRSEFSATYKFSDDPRVTRFGRVLRNLSLDELPQFFNVLAGDLSLVGPRPITEDELPRYGPWTARLLEATPGMTGYWQVNGRSRLSYDERVLLDMAYIDGWSFRLDATILAKTPGALRSGAS